MVVVMKTLMAVTVAAVSMAFGAGCTSTADTVRHYAAAELQCPEARVRTREIAPGTYVACGCGRRTMYLDNSAPSYIPTPQPGTDTVTLRVAGNP